MIQVGDKLPAGTLQEFIEVEGNGCSVGPNTFKVEDQVKGKKIAIFGLPGAYTPTCTAKHVPGYVQNAEAFKHLSTVYGLLLVAAQTPDFWPVVIVQSALAAWVITRGTTLRGADEPRANSDEFAASALSIVALQKQVIDLFASDVHRDSLHCFCRSFFVLFTGRVHNNLHQTLDLMMLALSP